MHSGDRWRLGHRPGLDGLRGIAIGLVIASHVVARYTVVGPFGVTAFFTLSGFLITALLLQEQQDKGRVRLGAFYARRARRLVPALAVFLVVMLVAGVATVGQAALALGYSSNWALVAGHDMGGIGHTWSLAVEEHFYLLWPLLVIAAARVPNSRAVMGAIAGLGIAASWLLRAALWHDGFGAARVYYGSDTRADALLVGCALAIWLSGRRARPTRTTVVPLLVMGAAAAAGSLTTSGGARYMLVPALVPLLTAAVLPFDHAALSWAPLRWLGRRSYAVYLWHVPLLAWLPAVFAIPLALLAAELSWRLVEQRFTRSRHTEPVEVRARPVGARRSRGSETHHAGSEPGVDGAVPLYPAGPVFVEP